MTYQFNAELDPDPEGMISVALSPVQLAAIMNGLTINPHELLVNRLWGAAGVVGGIAEAGGSAFLLADPDPTISKVLGYAGMVHASDWTATSLRQVWTGQTETTLTAQAATGLARSLGLSPEAAGIAGTIIDIAVPTGVAATVARLNRLTRVTRVAQVRAGFISLENEEQVFTFAGKPGASAHTLRDHVGKTLTQMLERFGVKPSLEATGSFTSLAEAEQAVKRVLDANKRIIEQWAAAPGGKPLRLSEKLAEAVGEGVINPAKNTVTPGATRVALQVRTVTVVLNKTNLHGRTWYVLTAFPDILRDLGLMSM